MSKVFDLVESSKQQFPVHCPRCATTLIIRHGTFLRAHQEEQGQITVQRYLCKSPRCPRKTFSVLPYPFLPIIRHFYQVLLRCHYLHGVQGKSQAHVARHLQLTRGIVKRLGLFCRRLVPWLKHEQEITDWGPDPTAKPDVFWANFCRDFSQTFYPKRWARFSSDFLTSLSKIFA